MIDITKTKKALDIARRLIEWDRKSGEMDEIQWGALDDIIKDARTIVGGITPTIICCGNPLDGYEFCGPFQSDAEAITWAERHCTDAWWIADLDPPVEPKVQFKWRNINPEE